MKASRSIRPLRERFHEKYEKTDGCWIWKAAKTPKGYGLISSKPDKPLYAHRVAYELENGPIRHGMFVCHTCDNPSCVNPSHLFLGTAKDNTQDMMRKGRFVDNLSRVREKLAKCKQMA